MEKKPYYLTTAIAYTSGKPHIGNTYEIVLADAIVRYKRFQGYDVRFQTGTDEHGQKIELKAEEKGVTPKQFVDEYMQMKKDGHIKFYTQDEWNEIAGVSGLKFLNGFETAIRFPRKKETALEFDDIMKRHDEKVIKGYEVEVVGDEIWITERVNNLFFEKN